MDYAYIIIAAVVVFFIASRLMGASGSKSISTADLKTLISKKDLDYFYMDVRTPGEFKSNKIKGFKNIPLDQIKNRLTQIPQDKKVVVICQSGARSSAACRQLSKAGYKDITNVRGGMNMWR